MASVPPRFTAADFRKSSRSDPDKECVLVARQAGWVEMRDSKTAFGAANDRRLVLTELEGSELLRAVKSGQFDR